MSKAWELVFAEKMVTIPKVVFDLAESKETDEKFMLLGKAAFLFYVIGDPDFDENEIAQKIIDDLVKQDILLRDIGSPLGFTFNETQLEKNGNKSELDTLNKKSFGFNQSEKDKLRETRKRVYRYMENTMGRPLHIREIDGISEWIDNFGFTEEGIIFILQQFYDKNSNNFPYIDQVVRGLHEEKIIEADKIMAHFSNKQRGDQLAQKISSYLALGRSLTSPELKLIDSWINVSGYSVDQILNACDRTVVNRRPSLAHVDTILKDGVESDSSAKNPNITKNKNTNKFEKPKRVKKSFEEYEEFS